MRLNLDSLFPGRGISRTCGPARVSHTMQCLTRPAALRANQVLHVSKLFERQRMRLIFLSLNSLREFGLWDNSWPRAGPDQSAQYQGRRISSERRHESHSTNKIEASLQPSVHGHKRLWGIKHWQDESQFLVSMIIMLFVPIQWISSSCDSVDSWARVLSSGAYFNL